MFAGPRPLDSDLDVEVRTVGFTGLPLGARRELRLERQTLTIGHLKRRGHRRDRSLIAGDRTFDPHRTAVSWVELEVFLIDAHVDLFQLDWNTFDEGREGVACDRHCRRIGVDVDL